MMYIFLPSAQACQVAWRATRRRRRTTLRRLKRNQPKKSQARGSKQKKRKSVRLRRRRRRKKKDERIQRRKTRRKRRRAVPGHTGIAIEEDPDVRTVDARRSLAVAPQIVRGKIVIAQEILIRREEHDGARDHDRKDRDRAKDREKEDRDRKGDRDGEGGRKGGTVTDSRPSGSDRPPEPVHPPRQPSQQYWVAVEPERSKRPASKGKGKDTNKKWTCKFCGGKTAPYPSAMEQHRWSNETCLTWQRWNQLSKEEQEKDNSWNECKEYAQRMRLTRRTDVSEGTGEPPARLRL